MAYNPWDEQDPFGTYQEPVNPMTVLDYLKAVGDAGKGIAGGAVRAPHVMTKGIDDIIDMFKGQDTSKDSAIVRGTSILDQLAHKIVPENEVGKLSSEMIGENILAGVAGRGAITAPKIINATTANLAPTIVQAEGERLGLTPEQTMMASLAAGAVPGVGTGMSKREIMAGKGAKGAPLDDIARAEKLRAEGMPARDIFVETGISFGPDGLPRHYISDATAYFYGDYPGRATSDSQGYLIDFDSVRDVTKIGDEGKKLGAVIHHPQLFNAYPDVADYTVKWLTPEQTAKGVKGSLNNDTKTILLDPTTSPANALETIIHEVQHKVQIDEGFGLGATGSWADNMLRVSEKAGMQSQFRIDNLKKELDIAKKYGYEDEVKRIEGEIKEATDIRDGAFAFTEKYADNPHQLYRDSAGEIEARMAQGMLRAEKNPQSYTNPSYNYPLDYITGSKLEDAVVRDAKGMPKNLKWFNDYMARNPEETAMLADPEWLKQNQIEGWTDAYGNPVNTDDIIQTRIAGATRDIGPLNRRNEKGYLTSPIVSELQKGNYNPEDVAKGNAGKLIGRMDNPIFRAMDEARMGGGQIEYVDNLFARPLTWEKMVDDGRPLIMLPADKTSVGMVRKIGGVELKTPIRTEGGPMHSEWQRDWASMEDAAQGKQRHANKVADETGMEPRYVYLGMDHEGSNFSTMASEGVLRYLEAVGDLTEEGKKLLDKKMRSLPDVKDNKGIAKDWPGYQSWDQMLEWLTNQEIGGSTTVGNRRKAFMNAIKAKEFQNHGAPDVEDVYAAINEPDISQYGSGQSGFRAADAVYTDPYSLEHRPQGHGSYDTRIPLGEVYAMDPNQMIPWSIAFPEMAAARADKAPAKAARSAALAGSGIDYQMPNEEWLNRILQYIQQQGQQR